VRAEAIGAALIKTNRRIVEMARAIVELALIKHTRRGKFEDLTAIWETSLR